MYLTNILQIRASVVPRRLCGVRQDRQYLRHIAKLQDSSASQPEIVMGGEDTSRLGVRMFSHPYVSCG
jgi:hypothetical protein